MAATRLGSAPAAAAVLAAFLNFAGFDFAGADFFFDAAFFFAFVAMGAKTITWWKELLATCGMPSPDDCVDFFLRRESPQMFSPGPGSKTPDRNQILPARAAPPGFLRQRDP